MPDYIVLSCPNCGAKTSVQAGTGLITCDYCGSQMMLKPEGGAMLAPATRFVVAQPGAQSDAPARERGQAPRPHNIRVESIEGGVAFVRRWFSASHIFMALFCVFWDGFLLFWYGMAFQGGAPVFFFLFPLIHLSIGVYLTYTTLAGFVNSTTVIVDREGLAVQHGPLPWPGERNLRPNDLEQLYTREVTSRNRNGSNTTYTLSAILRSGEKVDLIKGLDSPEAGLYLEQQIERRLGIGDQAVAGEVR